MCDVVGDFPAPLRRAFPGVEQAAWAPYRRRYPGVFAAPDRWRLRDWCFVVRAWDGGRPVWGPGSDVQPDQARQTRRRLLDQLEAGASRHWHGRP